MSSELLAEIRTASGVVWVERESLRYCGPSRAVERLRWEMSAHRHELADELLCKGTACLARRRPARELWSALSARRRALQERLTRPVVQRVGTYLTTLFPGCQLAMTDELEISGLVAGNQLERFEALSGGEKEQLGLLIRLALADVLRRDGTLPLLLDDSTVNSDSQRMQQLQTLLYRAARKLQIIVFACHDHSAG